MHIISLIRESKNNLPDTFTVGAKPTINGVEIAESAPVKEIKFFETNATFAKVFRGPFYMVDFTKSTVKRFIPAEEVIDLAVETAKEPVKNAEDIELGDA